MQSTSSQAIRRAMYRRGLYYGTYDNIANLGFWSRLCQAAMLLGEGRPPRPTLYAPDWLSLPWKEQLSVLVDAWVTMPANSRIRAVRRQILPLLLDGEELRTSYQRETSGLEALGIYERGDLTYWGAEFLNGTLRINNKISPQPWEIVDKELHTPYPPDWNLLWELEGYLMPIDPGIYSLDDKALRKAVQLAYGNVPDLLRIIQQGLQAPPSPDLVNQLEMQPTLKVLPGLVLEFSSTEELKQLRQNASIRQDLAAVLSPHHVYVDIWQQERVLNRLQRCSVITNNDIMNARLTSHGLQTHLTTNERAYLLSIVLICDEIGVPLSAPTGLFAKLLDDLPLTLRASAARKVNAALKELQPPSAWSPEKDIPPVPTVQMVDEVQEVIEKQQAIDILYQKADKYQPEHRRVTPLNVEQRGLRFYLIAYCHSRRANRTFRLDRLQLLAEPPPS